MRPEIKHFVGILPEPCFLVRPAGEIVFANAAAELLVGADKKNILGRSFVELFTDPRDKVDAYLRLCARSRQLVPGALSVGAEGNAVSVRCDGAVIEPRDDAGQGLVFIRCRPKAEATDHFVLLNQKIAALSKEILERKKAEQQRDELLRGERSARLEAERNSRMKDEFLATLSHELRTPLNAILGWTALLESEPLSPNISEGVEVIARNARVQKQLIEDLLDMSRIISGKVRLDVQRVELATVIESAVASARPAANAKGIRLQVTLDPIAGPVKGDPNRLEQVVWNLLNNAVKFTPKGGRVQVFLERVNSHLEITVADNGIGIKPEFLPHVFDRFRQQDSSTTRHQGGLGLGLSIAKQLVELHGGSIRARSPGEGKGASFSVILPLLLLHESPGNLDQGRVHPATSAAEIEAYEQDLRGVVALVVDDEPDARAIVQKLLQRCGASVHAAPSAAAALAFLSQSKADVLISDIGMPDTDGYELIRQVRSRASGDIPALALTAFARSEDRMRAMMAGYNLHLSKPLEPNELIVAVASLTGRTGLPPQRNS